MSTPEQLTLIRQVIHYRELRYADKEREITDALIALYADAERFQALERAHEDEPTEYWCRWSFDRDCWEPRVGTLAELADGLREPKP